ncbi:MAG: [LysW]-lysine hydrolase [Chloroflexi bacterium]|nr:[LysW]-lysine hydrolase [Chloroflexota bacterium]
MSETLTGLVSAYSPSGAEGAAVRFLVERMRALGYDKAFVDPAGNAVGVLGRGPRQIVLLGHIDTVPGEIEPRVDGDAFYGRGSVDAKGPLATFTDAAAAAGARAGWQVVVIGAVGEEADSPGARYVKDVYRPEMALIGEPSRWDRVTLGYKGSAWLELTWQQAVGHTAGNALPVCERAVAGWQQLVDWANLYNEERQSAFEQLLLSLRGMNSGDDGFTDWAKLKVNARLPVGLSPQEFVEQVRVRLPEAQVREMGYAIAAHRAERNTPLVRALLDGIRGEGGKPGFVLKTGTADMNVVAPLWQCPIAAYGPGDSNLDHAPNEHISLSEYAAAVRVLTRALARMMD